MLIEFNYYFVLFRVRVDQWKVYLWNWDRKWQDVPLKLVSAINVPRGLQSQVPRQELWLAGSSWLYYGNLFVTECAFTSRYFSELHRPRLLACASLITVSIHSFVTSVIFVSRLQSSSLAEFKLRSLDLPYFSLSDSRDSSKISFLKSCPQYKVKGARISQYFQFSYLDTLLQEHQINWTSLLHRASLISNTLLSN